MPDLSDRLRADSAMLNRGKGYLLVWFLAATTVAAAIQAYFLAVHDYSTMRDWQNLKDQFGSRGPIVWIIRFLLIQGIGTAFFGLVSVALSLLVVRLCTQFRALRWVTLGILVANVLWSGFLVLFALGDDHGDLQMPEESLAAIAPSVVASMVVGIAIAVREQRAQGFAEPRA